MKKKQMRTDEKKYTHIIIKVKTKENYTWEVYYKYKLWGKRNVRVLLGKIESYQQHYNPVWFQEPEKIVPQEVLLEIAQAMLDYTFYRGRYEMYGKCDL